MKRHRGVECAGCGEEVTNDYPTYCVSCTEAPFCTLCTINDVEICIPCKSWRVRTPYKEEVACEAIRCDAKVKGKCCGYLLCSVHLERHLSNHSNVLGLMIPFITIQNCIGLDSCIAKGGYRTRFGELCPNHISNQICCGCNSYFPNKRYYCLKLNVARVCCVDCGWKLKHAIWCMRRTLISKDLIGKIVRIFANLF
jgi:hypothetical protein